jgi:predicted amidohydrolase
MKAASIQMCSTANLDENLHCVERLISIASCSGALLAVLPEMFALFGQSSQDKILMKEPYGAGKIQQFMSTMAKKYNIWIVAGTIPIASQNPDKIRAACIVFDNLGNQVARYDKIHLFDVVLSEHERYKESDSTEPGNAIVTVNSPIGKLGLCVCYDLRFPPLFELLAKSGVEVLIAPSAFTVPTGEAHWHLLTRSRAIDTQSYLIGACQGGSHDNGRSTYGHSLIISPWGDVISEAQSSGECVLVSDIDLSYVHEIRKKIPTRTVI